MDVVKGGCYSLHEDTVKCIKYTLVYQWSHHIAMVCLFSTRLIRRWSNVYFHYYSSKRPKKAPTCLIVEGIAWVHKYLVSFSSFLFTRFLSFKFQVDSSQKYNVRMFHLIRTVHNIHSLSSQSLNIISLRCWSAHSEQSIVHSPTWRHGKENRLVQAL